jgi:phosphonate transport system substrate-binding protein
VRATLSFGISRSHAGRSLDLGAQLLADALGTRLGRRIAVTVTPDYERLLEGVLMGAVAIAWMPPLLHVRAGLKGAPLACVSQRNGALTYRSALVVRKDSERATIAQLHGARAAWADPSSASGCLFPQLHLTAAGIDPSYDLASERYYGSTAAACRAVVDGAADLSAHYISDRAGAASDGGWPAAHLELRQALGDSVGGELRILDVTEPIPPDGMVLAPPLDGRLQATVRDALLSLHDDPAGARALDALAQADRLLPVTADVVKILARLRAHVPEG